MSDDVTLVPVRRFTASAFRTVRTSTIPATPTRCAAEIARFSPGDVRLRRLHEGQRGDLQGRLRAAGRRAFRPLDRHGPDRTRDDPAGEPRSVFGLVSQFFRTRLRVCVQLPSTADRRQSFHGQFDVLPDRIPGAPLGRALCDRRHRRPGRGPGQVDRGPGQQAPVQRRRPRSPWRMARHRRRRSPRARRSRPTSWCPTRIPPRPTAICWRRRRGAAGPTAHRRARYSMSLFVWYFGTPPVSRCVRTTPSCSGRATASCSTDIFERKVLADDFSLYLHRPTATDPLAALPGCDAFYVLSPVPHLRERHGLAAEAERYRAAIARQLARHRAARAGNEIVSSPYAHPAGLPGPSGLLPRRRLRFGARPHAERLVPAAQSQRRDRGLYLVGAGHILARDCPAWSPPLGSWTWWCPMPLLGPEGGHAENADDHARCAELLRHGSETFYAASMVLPPRLREPATMLYAFCRWPTMRPTSTAAGPTRSPACADACFASTRGPAAAAGRSCFRRRASPVRRAGTLLDALFEGFEWDAAGRRYDTLADLTATPHVSPARSGR